MQVKLLLTNETSASATIHENHMDMTKFSSKNGDYERIAGTLIDWTNSLETLEKAQATGESKGILKCSDFIKQK